MPYKEVPTNERVATELDRLRGRATAVELCDALVRAGFPRRDSQLAIQRATEAGRISMESDWTLVTVKELVAA